MVVATDRGSPHPLSSLARLTVRITDRNDNPPVFEQVSHQAYNLKVHFDHIAM